MVIRPVVTIVNNGPAYRNETALPAKSCAAVVEFQRRRQQRLRHMAAWEIRISVDSGANSAQGVF